MMWNEPDQAACFLRIAASGGSNGCWIPLPGRYVNRIASKIAHSQEYIHG